MYKIHGTDAQMQRHLELFKIRPRMLVKSAANYTLVQNYIEGYLDGLSAVFGYDFRNIIDQWYRKKNNIEEAIELPNYIATHFAGRSEKELRHLLVDTISEYFKENPLLSS
jgi:hypothetical protein